jgi:coatomer protein complex subunit gamma
MLQSIERYMKQAIVDKLSSVSSAALVSSLHLMKQGPEVVKRWVNEVQETVNSDNVMVQYHALGLLYQIKRTDKLAVTKLVQKFSSTSLKSPYAYCFLVSIFLFLLSSSFHLYSSFLRFVLLQIYSKKILILAQIAFYLNSSIIV